MTLLEFVAVIAVVAYLLQAIAVHVNYHLQSKRQKRSGHDQIFEPLERHFRPIPISDLNVSERQFPYRVRADLHRAIHHLFETGTTILNFCGARKQYEHTGIKLSDCLVPALHDPVMTYPAEYEEIDIGES